VQTLRRPSPPPLANPSLFPARLWLAEGSRLVWAQEQEVLVPEGDPALCWHFIDSGAVSLSATSPLGRRSLLAILGSGGVFGPPSDPFSVRPEARALVASKLLLVPATALDRLVRQDGAIAAWMCSMVRRQSDRFQRSLVSALAPRVLDRVRGAFAELARTHGRPAPGGLLIPLPLPQETVAAVVGATRESVNRAIRTLEARGAIRRSGRCYVVQTTVINQGG
jgi:CRP/FNR family cyclic AMP-dependent transcriptional regulator